MDVKTDAQAFWQAWQAQEPILMKLSPNDFVNQANDLLAAYLQGVYVELEGDTTNGKLVFTAQGILDNFAKVTALVATARTQNFTVVGFREGMTAENVIAHRNPDFDINEFCIGMGDVSLKFADLQVVPTAGHYLVDLAIKINHKQSQGDPSDELANHLKNMAFIILDHVIGEWDFAVKIGAVDFVETLPADPVAPKDLNQVIEHIWQNELGHTGEYPEESSYAVARVEEDDEQDGLIFTINRSASALLGDPNMAWCIKVTSEFDNQDQLELARDLQDDMTATLVKKDQCIDAVVVVNVTQRKRTVIFYCQDAVWGAKQAQQCVDRFPMLHSLVEIEYDPNWGWYQI